VEGNELKLIDMGAVRRADDLHGDVYGSRGYAAPEAADAPSHLADLYSVARALAVLVADFDFQGKYEYSLPLPDEVPVFGQYESLYRFLLKATRADPAARFQTAAEMAEQLTGVLRDAALDAEDIGPIESALFDHDVELHSDTERTGGGRGSSRRLPALK